MNIRGIVTIILLLCYSTSIIFSQTLDLQFATEIDCDLELYHVTLQTKVTQTGQTANLGNTSVLFDYNASALDFLDYESIHFDGSDMCIGVISAWGSHGIDGVSDGVFNLTINLEVPVNETQAFASCPTITDDWVDIAKITFSIENMNSTSNLMFSPNNEYISFNNYYPNDGSNQILRGIFYDLNEPFVCISLEAPTASISTNTNSGNAPLPINFVGTGSSDSDGTIVSYAWDFGDGSTGTGSSASHTYTSSGTYTTTLTVTDNDGLTDETTVSISVGAALEAPTASISTNTNSGNAPLPINFVGTGSSDSDGTIVSYAWDFGDGSTGTGSSASHTYTSAGNYSVTLTVTDNDGLTDETTVSISVGAALEAPIASISTNTNSGNAPLPINFVGTGSSDSDGTIVSYAWDFGDGSTGTGSSASHTYTSAGNYSVTLTVTDNDGLTDASLTTISVGQELLPPNATIVADSNSGNAPFAVNFDGSSSTDSDGSISSYSWNFGDGNTGSGLNVNHNFSAGTYTVTLTVTDNDGLTDVSSTTILVDAALVLPTSEITTDTNSGEAPLPVNFDGSNSSDSDGNIVSYAWDFGDGSTDSGINVNHTFASAGEYTVSLTVTDNDDLTHTTTTTIVVSEEVIPLAPTAEITTDTNSGEAPLPVNFDGSNSSDSDGTIISYAWDFGDGSTDSGINVNHTFASAGEYIVSLTVTDNDDLAHTTTTTIVVSEEVIPLAPTAEITTDTNIGLAPLPVNFDGSNSSDSDGTIISYAWDFGDGSTDSGINVNHTFASAGEYTVSLTVTDNDDLTHTTTTTIVVSEEVIPLAPTAEITTDTNSGEAPLPVNFDGSNSSDSDGNIVSYAWDFGDGSTDSGINVNHTFASAGEYTVSLTVTDNDDLTHTTTTTIVVSEEVIPLAPTADITTDTNSGEAPLPVNFDGSNSSDSDGTIVSYAWDFGDGSTDSGINVNHTFASAGEYTVSLTVTDNDDLTHTTTRTIVVSEEVIPLAPTAEITTNTNSGEAPLPVNFDGSNSSDSDGTIVSYAWDFGDGSTDSGLNVNHTFASAGEYTVSLTVTDNDDLTHTTTTTIVVSEEVIPLAPTAEITTDTNSGLAPLPVNFDGSNSSDSDGTIISYAWDFGDGSTDSGLNVNHTFASAGEYTVSLTVTDNDDLTHTTTTTIVVSEEVIPLAPTAEITTDTNSGDAPLAVFFDGSNSNDSDGNIVSYAWDFGNGVSGNGMNSNYLFTTPGSYTVSLTVTDNDGLTHTATTTITVSEAVEYFDPIAEITLTGPTNLGGGNYQVDLDGSASSDPDGGDLNYEWFVDGELFDTDVVTVLILSAGASSNIELKVTDDEGDTASDFASVSTDCEIDITEVYEDFTKMICSGEEANIREVFANDLPENNDLIDQEGEVVLETDVLSFNNSSCDVADFIFTIHYTVADSANCSATFYNYTYIIGVYPNLSGQIEYQEDCVIHLNTCEQFDVSWSDGENTGQGVSYSGDIAEGVITFQISDTAAPENCSSTEVNAEINCVIPCNDAEKNICIDPTLTAELCPEFCDLPNDDYIIVSAHTQYNCSLQLLGNNCINFIPVPGFTGISKVEIVACTQITASEIFCDTVYYNIAVGDCEQAPSQNATVEEINNNCEIEDIDLCVAPYETEEICLDYCGVTKVIVDIKSSLNSIVGIENSNCINYIPNPFYESGTDEIEIFVCDLDVNCQTVKITVEIDPACSNSAESRDQVVNCKNLFSTVLTPNNDGRNDIWRVKNTGSCFNDYNEMQLTIMDKYGNVIHQNFDGELPQWDGKIARGQQADEGVYYYILQVAYDEKTISHTGYIELRY